MYICLFGLCVVVAVVAVVAVVVVVWPVVCFCLCFCCFASSGAKADACGGLHSGYLMPLAMMR